MTYTNYGQAPQAPTAPTAPQAQQFTPKDTMVFGGTITQDPEVRYTDSGKAVLNLDFVMNSTKVEGGSQFARVTFWEDKALIAAHFLKKGDRFTGVGERVWREYTRNDGTQGRSLEYERASLHLDLMQIVDLVRTEIGMALQQSQPTTEQAPVQTQQQTQPIPNAQPQTPTQESPILDITSDELPF